MFTRNKLQFPLRDFPKTLDGVIYQIIAIKESLTKWEYRMNSQDGVIIAERSIWTPTVTSGTGTLTTAGATSAGACQYWKIGNRYFYRVDVTIITNGTGATNIKVTLPATPSGVVLGFGRAAASSGKMIQAFSNALATLTITNYDDSYPASSGERLIVDGWWDE